MKIRLITYLPLILVVVSLSLVAIAPLEQGCYWCRD